MPALIRTATLAPLGLAVALALSACQPQSGNQSATTDSTTSTAHSQVQNEEQKLDAFFADSFKQDLKESPMGQSYLGIKWDYDKWDDISPAAEEKRAERMQNRLQQAKQFDTSQLSDQQQLSLRIYIEDLQRRLANDEFRHHTYVMDQFRAWHTTVPSFLINMHRISDIDDANAYIARLQAVNPLFDQVIEQLRIREALGVYPPKWAYDQMLQASQNVISGHPFEESPNQSTLWQDFTKKLDALNISHAEKSGLRTKAEQALNESVKPAYQALIKELGKQALLTPEGDGVWRLPDGDKWYKNRLAWFTTTGLTADEVHRIGLDNVARIHQQMRDIMQKVGFAGSLQDFFKFMRNDPQFYYPDSEQGRADYLTDAKALIDEMEARIPEYFGILPKARIQVKRVEAFREKSAGKAFYQSPAKDGSRPGTYYANLYKITDMPNYQMAALAYHEGIPGHHMQRSIAQELEGVPDFQKYVTFTAYTEGWGLYTEELAKDMGFYQDPYSDFGRLAMELWRACRLVVDTGIHSKKWSREQAIAYLVENTPNAENDAKKAIERYIAMPGQATAYMIGKLEIMALRDKAMQALGDNFDYRGFHDEILKDGPVPLSLLREKVDNWIASKRAG